MRLWVIEYKHEEKWDACDLTSLPYIFTNRFQAGSFKRTIQEKLGWSKNKFRVREYRRVEK